MLTRLGQVIEAMGRHLMAIGQRLQAPQYPKITPIYEDTKRPNRDTPIYPGEF